jgi:hypothetical protein
LDSRCPECDQAVVNYQFSGAGTACLFTKAPLWFGASGDAGIKPDTTIHVQLYLGLSDQNPNATVDVCNFPVGGTPNYKAFSFIDQTISLASLSSTVGKNPFTGKPENQIFMLCDADRSPACFAH